MKSRIAKIFFLQVLFVFSLFSQDEINVKIKIFQGKETIPFAGELAKISNVVYKEYPYLYDVEDDEQFYLTKFCHSSGVKLCLAYDGDNIVGYVIGVPLKDYPTGPQQPFFQQPFIDTNLDVEIFFYIGEIALLPHYRKKKIGKEMLLQIEKLVKNEGRYSNMCLVHIDESQIEKKKPQNYASLSTFWIQLGYEKMVHLTLSGIKWKNVGESDVSEHTLIYWIKPL